MELDRLDLFFKYQMFDLTFAHRNWQIRVQEKTHLTFSILYCKNEPERIVSKSKYSILRIEPKK